MDKKKILIIDDEQYLSEAIKMNLEDTDKFIVETQTDGKKILEFVDDFSPDLIILDMVMPGISGIQVQEILKNSETARDIPVIFLTGTARKEDPKGQGVIIDGRYTIAKPIQADQMADVLINYLNANPNLGKKKYMDW